MKESKLNIQLMINEHGLTPDPTDIHCHLSLSIKAPSVSMSRKKIILATPNQRVYRNNYSGAGDKMFYIKNIGKTNLSLRGTTSDESSGEIFGALIPEDVTLFRLKAGINLFAKNLSSTDDAEIEFAYWECKENA